MIGPTGQGLVFLLGLPRSGTTLLSSLLHNHPAVMAPPEPWIMLALHQLGRVSPSHPANSQVLGTAVRRFVAGAGTDGDDGHVLAARAAALTLYNGWLRRFGKRRFVDKSPRYHLILDFLFAVFPDADYLWLLRDPLDTAASHLSTWGQDLARSLTEGLDDAAVIDLLVGLDRLETFHAAHPENVHQVRYESLALNPGSTLKTVFARLDLFGGPADPLAVTGIRQTADALGSGLGDTKILATDRPHAASIGAWREVLELRQRQTLLDALGAERLTRLGYGATVDALRADGAVDQGSDVAARHQARAEELLSIRLANIDHMTTLAAPLPPDFDTRFRNLFSS